jgi:hypothetical protein
MVVRAVKESISCWIFTSWPVKNFIVIAQKLCCLFLLFGSGHKLLYEIFETLVINLNEEFSA